ncbi:hypothetical protein LNV08_22515, partial [Paucibacter sp. TC2R-5]|uniref:hypothetical protein n=1 Tax=Paucibacter sp. TC2R-5 TaxID=2893555 RepID=UPI0021E3F3CF
DVRLGTFKFAFCHLYSPKRAFCQSTGLAFPQHLEPPAIGNWGGDCKDELLIQKGGQPNGQPP